MNERPDLPHVDPNQPSWLLDAAAKLSLLLIAALLAYQMRMQIPLGQELLADPQFAQSGVAMAVIVTVLTMIARTTNGGGVIRRHPFRLFALGVVFSGGAMLLLPGMSQLQIAYFVAVGMLLGGLCLVLPRRLYQGYSIPDVLQTLRAVIKHRPLLGLWLSFNIQTRYKQRVLGSLWVVLLPISTSLVIAFAFSQFMRVNISVPFIAFYMSALVPYNFFANNLFGSTNAILGRIGIITQVYFPREILILLLIGESLFDFVFTFAALLIINLFFGVLPSIHFVFLPLLFVLLLLLALGLMFLISTLTVLLRDIPQFLSVGMQLLFFLTPVIYPVEQFPEQFRYLFLINPIAPVIQGFRDVITFGRPPELISLCYPLACAAVALCVGYAVFKRFENEMTDLL